MVFFTCNNCGTTLKKKEVERHYCRGQLSLTCVDCLKDFGTDYVKHTVCVSEHQRYSAKGLSGGPERTKQQIWVETVHEAVGRAIDDGIAGQSKNALEIMKYLLQQNIIPDKAKTFKNYIKNGNLRVPDKDIDFVWGVLDKARNDLKAAQEAERKAKAEKQRLNGKNKGAKDNSSSDSDSSSDESEKEGTTSNKSDFSTDSCEKDSSKKAEKKKKRMVSESDSVVNGSTEFRKSKKSKKDSEENESENGSNLNTALDACHLREEPKAEEQKLSKKERKERKKRNKYEAELQEIQSVQADEASSQEEPKDLKIEDVEERKSKTKKNKKNKNVEENPSVVEEEAAAGETKKKKDKKKKKNHVDEEVEQMDTDTSDIKLKKGKSESGKLNETLNMDDLQNVKFSWDDAILGILQSLEEIPLKKLSKKVCNGYLSSLGEYSQDDEIKAVNKFHKKLHKMHNVVVLKERVKLKTSRD